MLDQKYLLENIGLIRERLESRGGEYDLDEIVKLGAERSRIQRKAEELRSERNKTSDLIASRKNQGLDSADLITAMRRVGDEIADLEEKRKGLDEAIRSRMLDIPNIPHESVPAGPDSSANLEVRRWGRKPELDFEPQAHWDIGKNLGILDFDRAAKLAGSRFAVYYGAGARLERALINFMLDVHTGELGFKEVLPPFIANAESLTGTGNLPKFRDDLFKLEGYDWYLIPTAEVPLTNLHRDEILEAGSLPKRYVAYTPCFRSEAGSYGKDVRGLIRQHQFNKVEMMTFSLPEKSFEELEYMTAAAGEILKRLGLHHRVVVLSTGDMGFASAKTYDLEVWMPSRDGFMEISSCSNCTDFQARRAGIRFKRGPKARPEFVNTLNGSGLAVGRTVSALLENYQQADGSVAVPEVLRPYLGGLKEISGNS